MFSVFRPAGIRRAFFRYFAHLRRQLRRSGCGNVRQYAPLPSGLLPCICIKLSKNEFCALLPACFALCAQCGRRLRYVLASLRAYAQLCAAMFSGSRPASIRLRGAAFSPLRGSMRRAFCVRSLLRLFASHVLGILRNMRRVLRLAMFAIAASAFLTAFCRRRFGFCDDAFFGADVIL